MPFRKELSRLLAQLKLWTGGQPAEDELKLAELRQRHGKDPKNTFLEVYGMVTDEKTGDQTLASSYYDSKEPEFYDIIGYYHAAFERVEVIEFEDLTEEECNEKVLELEAALGGLKAEYV